MTKKKTSAKKKLLPAAGMLALSAAMLSSATFAWFTMSREVEVKNISMTATVPEDIQISLGALGSATTRATSSNDNISLANSTGVLYASAAHGADNGQATAPSYDWEWSNTADISAYYEFGKLIPASSTNGEAIYFTADADGVGKTIKKNSVFYQADSGTVNSAAGALESTVLGSTSGGNLKTTAHAKDGATWTPSGSTAFNATGDDGYYVDIPVWLRTSSTEGAKLTVQAYVKPRKTTQTLNGNDEALYKAVRVALLNTTQATGAKSTTNTGLIDVKDGWTASTNGTTAGSLIASPFDGTSILNWYNGNSSANVAAKAASTAATRADAAVYGPATVYNGTATAVELAAGTGVEYGTPTKAIIRVWLEGEDPDCWNDTAGQDWSINLKFSNGSATNVDINETAPATTPTGG